jgi:hypothetical protein
MPGTSLIALRGTGGMKTVTCSFSPTDKLDKRHPLPPPKKNKKEERQQMCDVI